MNSFFVLSPLLSVLSMLRSSWNATLNILKHFLDYPMPETSAHQSAVALSVTGNTSCGNVERCIRMEVSFLEGVDVDEGEYCSNNSGCSSPVCFSILAVRGF